MTEEISSISGSRGQDPADQAVYQLWQQQIDRIRAARAAGPAEGVAPVDAASGAAAAPRLTGDTAGVTRADAMLSAKLPSVDLDRIEVPGDAKADKLGPTGQALAELGVMATLAQVAAAFTQSTFSPGDIANSIGSFTARMTEVADQLNRLPGVGPALELFGGVGGIVTGLNGLKEEIAETKASGPSLSRGLGAAASAARLVSGVAMALAPVCAPLAAIGGTVALAGAALELGKLGWEGRGAAKSLGAKIIGSNGGSSPEGLTPIVSNNGANMVRVDMKQPFAWLTG